MIIFIKILNWFKSHQRFSAGLIVLASIICALIVGEIFIRLAFPSPVIDDPVLRIKPRPMAGRDINGFSNKKALLQADIVAMGDSQTDGNNATFYETWPYVLGVLSNHSIYQIAFGGWNPLQYYALLDQALSLKPKLLVLGIYFGNDLPEAYDLAYNYDDWYKWRDPAVASTTDTEIFAPDVTRLSIQTGLNADSWSFTWFKFRTWFRTHFRIYALIGDVTRGLREKLNLAETKDEKQARIATWLENNDNGLGIYIKDPNIQTIISPRYRRDPVDLSFYKTKEGFRLSRLAITKIKSKLPQNTNLTIVLIPTKEAVYGDYFIKTGQKLPSDLVDFMILENQVRQNFLMMCYQLKIACADVRPALTKALLVGQIIYPQTLDGHPIANGYAVIARDTYQFLISHGLVD